MNNSLTKLVICCLFVFSIIVPNESFAQKALPSGTQIVTEINGDTTSTGARKNTSYTLARGGVYFALGSIKNKFDLVISATGSSTLPDPKIIILTDASGNYSTPFTPYKNLTLNGISMSGVNSAGFQVSFLIEAGTTGIKINLKDCEIDSVVTAAIRVNFNDCSVFVEDCFVHNIAGGSHTGRFIDARRTIMDTISIVNSTFYNVMHNIVGRFEGGQNYFKFDHNTVYNLMRCPLRIDESPNIIVTNNLFIQTGFVGYIKYWEDAFLLENEEALGSRDEFARIEIWSLENSSTFKGQTQKTNFKYNNFWLDQNISTTFPDTIYGYKTLDFQFAKAIVGGDTLTWISEDCNFNKTPSCDYLKMAQTAWADGSTHVQPGFNNTGAPFNFAYSTSAKSYTAAAGGFPLGDLNWFPDQKAKWLLTTDVEVEQSSMPIGFSLGQNYPNPFNPSTTIQYEIPIQGNYSIKVYNSLGQLVSILVNEHSVVGKHNVSFDASHLSSGIYFYTLNGNNVNITKKMLLIK
jgi:hypothetical protein